MHNPKYSQTLTQYRRKSSASTVQGDIVHSLDHKEAFGTKEYLANYNKNKSQRYEDGQIPTKMHSLKKLDEVII